MDERGFFTLIGICFLIVAMFLVKGLQESAGNYFDITSDFKTEIELQNIADSALIEAVEIIKSPDFERGETSNFVRRYNQHKIIDDTNVEVFYEYGITFLGNKPNIYFMRKIYPSEEIVTTGKPNRKGYLLISVASRDGKFGKVYRRSLAYILEDDEGKLDDKKIYFMNDL